MNDFLDIEIWNKFANFTASKLDYLSKGNKHQPHFNLLCATAHRLNNCVNYLNTHSSQPETEEDFVLFLTMACMIKDAVNNLSKTLGVRFPYENTDQYFGKIYLNSHLNIENKNCPTDDEFFEYFRSLAFAHPFKTTRPKFLQEGETHYSPFVIHKASNDSRFCGFMIYSNKYSGYEMLVLPFDTLRDYIKSRYEVLDLITNHLIESYGSIPKKEVNRKLSPIEQYKNILAILNEQHIPNDSIKEALEYLTCESTIKENDDAIANFKYTLENILSYVSDAVDMQDYEKMYNVINKVLDPKINKVHEFFHYDKEKIFSDLNNNSLKTDIDWGLERVKSFQNSFAKKWVKYDIRNMSFTEIKMLTCIACHLEYIEQEGLTNELF